MSLTCWRKFPIVIFDEVFGHLNLYPFLCLELLKIYVLLDFTAASGSEIYLSWCHQDNANDNRSFFFIFRKHTWHCIYQVLWLKLFSICEGREREFFPRSPKITAKTKTKKSKKPTLSRVKQAQGMMHIEWLRLSPRQWPKSGFGGSQVTDKKKVSRKYRNWFVIFLSWS